MKRFVSMVILLLLSTAEILYAGGSYPLPPLPPPHEYGTTLIDRTASKMGVKPVIFSHWLHRAEASCRICHGELEFDMLPSSTPIREADNREGRFCGACHNGEFSFSVADKDNCPRCHTGSISSEKAKYAEYMRKGFSPTEYGDGINWVKSVKRNIVAPAGYIYTPGSEMISTKVIAFEAKLGRVPPAFFPHEPHGEWMDCSMCHPDLFPFDGKGKIARMTKQAMLKGEYCGLCHMRVAFPLNDCPRCHLGMEGGQR